MKVPDPLMVEVKLERLARGDTFYHHEYRITRLAIQTLEFIDRLKQEISGLQSLVPAEPDVEPVAWQVWHPDAGWGGTHKDHIAYYKAAGIPVRPLYTAPISAPAPIGDGELSREEQIDAYIDARGTLASKTSAIAILNALHALGFAIVRTAPSEEGK